MKPDETYQELYNYYKSNLENLKEKKNRLESQGNLCAYEICKISELEFHIETLSKTVKAVEKQLPMKPKYYIDMYGHNKPGCPGCPKNEILYAGQKFCSVCGTKIDWEVSI